MSSDHLQRVRKEKADLQAFRTGATVLGMFAGLAGGCFIAYLLVRTLVATEVSALLVFGGALAGALAGFLHSGTGISLFEAVLHYLIGYLSVDNEAHVRPHAKAPAWLRMALYLGIACGTLVIIFFGYRRWRNW